MRISPEAVEVIRPWIEASNAPEVRDRYRRRNIPRAARVKDIDKRFRWDLFWHGIPVKIRSAWMEARYAEGCNDGHIDTVLRKLVPAL